MQLQQRLGMPGRLLAPQELTGWLKAARTPQDLQALLEQHAGCLNFIHAAAAITRLAHLCDGAATTARSTPGRFATLPATVLPCITVVCSLVTQRAPEFQPRAVANSLWAVAKLDSRLKMPTGSALSLNNGSSSSSAGTHRQALASEAQGALSELLAALLAMLPAATSGFEPQHCSNVLYALALLSDSGSSEFNPGTSAARMPTGQDGSNSSVSGGMQQLQRLAAPVLVHSLPLIPHMTTQVCVFMSVTHAVRSRVGWVSLWMGFCFFWPGVPMHAMSHTSARAQVFSFVTQHHNRLPCVRFMMW
jgi:hypothetical protein